jgi:rhodanese-related sulfurtransferase
VNDQPQQTSHPKSGPLAILLEALVIAIVGVCVALIANQISPRGLNLARNYFPEIKPEPTPSAATNNPRPTATATATNPAPAPPSTNAVPSEAEQAIARLKAKGLQVVTLEQMEKLLHDPGYATGSIIFVDARDDDHYQAGHIPAALQLDYYHPDKYLPAVVTASQAARQVVVYCTGGDCEDSEMTAIMLRDGGVPNQKLFVYSGGMNEWEARQEPIETGARNSGHMRK